MLVYNGMLMGTGTVYKHLPATRSELTLNIIRVQLEHGYAHEHQKVAALVLETGVIWRQDGGGAGRH